MDYHCWVLREILSKGVLRRGEADPETRSHNPHTTCAFDESGRASTLLVSGFGISPCRRRRRGAEPPNPKPQARNPEPEARTQGESGRRQWGAEEDGEEGGFVDHFRPDTGVASIASLRPDTGVSPLHHD